MVGKMNRRPTFYNETFTVDAGGGPTAVISEQWQAWAHLDNRTGKTYAAQATELTNYDYRVKVRFDGRFTSRTWMIYEGEVCKLQQMQIETEGYKNYLVLRYSKTDTFIAIPSGNYSNWTSLTFDDTTGVITFLGGDNDGYNTQISFFASPYTGFNYISAENIGLSVGPASSNLSSETYFTPGDVIFKWRLTLTSTPYTPITDWATQTVTVTRLQKRWYSLYRINTGVKYGIPVGFAPIEFYNIAGVLNPTSCANISEVVTAWNNDVENVDFQIESNRVNNGYYEVLISPNPALPIYPFQYITVIFS